MSRRMKSFSWRRSRVYITCRGDRHQVLDRGLEQLVARVGLEHVHQGLAGVAHRVEPDAVDDLRRLLAQHRDPGHGLGVGGRGEQPEEAALADDLTVSSNFFTPT